MHDRLVTAHAAFEKQARGAKNVDEASIEATRKETKAQIKSVKSAQRKLATEAGKHAAILAAHDAAVDAGDFTRALQHAEKLQSKVDLETDVSYAHGVAAALPKAVDAAAAAHEYKQLRPKLISGEIGESVVGPVLDRRGSYEDTRSAEQDKHLSEHETRTATGPGLGEAYPENGKRTARILRVHEREVARIQRRFNALVKP